VGEEHAPGSYLKAALAGLDEVPAPIVNVVPLQWLAYQGSRRLGIDIDSFRRDEREYAAAQAKFTL